MARFNDNPSFENTKIVRKQHKANCQYMQLAKYGSQKHLATLYTAFPIMKFLWQHPIASAPQEPPSHTIVVMISIARSKISWRLWTKASRHMPPNYQYKLCERIHCICHIQLSQILHLPNPQTFSTLTIPNPHTPNIQPQAHLSQLAPFSLSVQLYELFQTT